MHNPFVYAGAGALAVMVLHAALFFIPQVREMVFGPHSFQDCVARFGIVEDSFPLECTTPGGKTFVDPAAAEQTDFVLFTDFTQPIGSPLVIEYALGNRMASGEGLVTVTDAQGTVIASSSLSMQEAGGSPMRQQVTLSFPPQQPGSAGAVLFIVPGNPPPLPIVFK